MNLLSAGVYLETSEKARLMPYTESNYENAVIEIFRDTLGYSYVYGPDVTREYSDPLYIDELLPALRRVNPKLPESARADMRRMVKRLLKKYDYPPEGVEDAIRQLWGNVSFGRIPSCPLKRH
jgi:hypothetical protein